MDLLVSIRTALSDLRRQTKEKHQRHYSVGDLLSDRWETALGYGFGKGTSCYDNVLILGEVTVGKDCWIGPNVILDGSGGLSIGDHVDICAGVQIYSHHTVRRATSGGVEPIEYGSTQIGSRVYVGPQAVISMGVSIGDGAIVGAMSFVNRNVPAGARVWGIPAAERAE